MSAVDVSAQVRAWALAEAGRQSFGEDFGVDFGVDITLNAMPGPTGAVQVGYLIVVSCRAPLLGQGPLFSMAVVPSPQPTEEQVAEVITATMRDVRALSAQMLKAPKAAQNGHG